MFGPRFLNLIQHLNTLPYPRQVPPSPPSMISCTLSSVPYCGEGAAISPTKGPARELTGVQLELTNPRARLSRTETRGKPFSCLGEFCWYFAGSDDASFIEYYIPGYKQFANGERIFGAYGPRLLNHDGHNQITNVIQRPSK